MTPKDSKAIIIGISGPSSSGKTTLTRLLQAVFSRHREHEQQHQQQQDELPGIGQTFTIHEDDFYLPDNQIPYKTTITGKTLQDWDTVDAYNIPLLTSTLAHVHETGALPENLRSIKDFNERTDSGVSEETIRELRAYVSGRLLSSSPAGGGGDNGKGKKSLALLEGILLFCPPDPHHVLYPLQGVLDARLFLPTAYNDVKTRREARSGYMTSGPAQELPLPQRSTSADDIAGTRAGAASESTTAEGNSEGQGNFWVDPPGYVDDVVWPNYALDHSWLLLPEGESKDCRNPVEVLKKIGDGTRVRTNIGIAVPPEKTCKPMVEVLRWAVDEVLKCWG